MSRLLLIEDDDEPAKKSKNEKPGNDVRTLKRTAERGSRSWKYFIFLSLTMLLGCLVASMLILLGGASVRCWLDRSGNSRWFGSFGSFGYEEKNEKSTEQRVASTGCSNVPKNSRFDCHPEDGASELSCAKRRCCWSPIDDRKSSKKNFVTPLSIPYCYYPEDWSIYKEANRTANGTVFLKKYADSAYKRDVELLRMDILPVNDNIVRIKIADARLERYEPYLPIVPDFNATIENPRFLVETVSYSPGFRIKTSRDNVTKLDAIGPPGFIFADQFLQISIRLPENSYVYGLGEHGTGLKLNMNWESLTMFNKDQPPTENANLYGSHPFFLAKLNGSLQDGDDWIGVLFLNSNAMDVVLQPTPAVTYRSIGGVFDFYIFMGPSPSAVIKQYSEIVGKPFMPPYWSLGFHLCRYGYGSLEKTRQVWSRTRAAGIPFDTQWNDLDYMGDNNDFTYDRDKFKDLPIFVEQLHEVGMHYIPLIDSGISGSGENGSYRPYTEGVRRGVLVQDGYWDGPFSGKAWNLESTVWPDFTKPETLEYWHDMMRDMWDMFRYDGAWLDMNEPSNFYNGRNKGCEKNDLDYPIYVPKVVGNLLATKTLCMNAKLHLGSHYDLHNIYGTSGAVATNRALTKIRRLRPFVVSRSTWVGHGFYGAHWSGDIYSSWHDMRMSVPQLLSYGLFQVPMMGADICGFDGNTTRSLCNRWSQLGAFYPFSRNHNSDDTIEQDPVAMGELVVKSSIKALMIRYRLLPYLYTLFFRAHTFGETVARPLFFEFSNDSATWDLDSQFLWGSSLMIIPVFQEGATQVSAYIPRGTWYDFYDKNCIISSGKYYTLEAPLDTIPLLVRGGSILPGQTPSKTTTESRKNPFQLLIAPDDLGMARGELYWDDGDSLDAIDKANYRWLRFNLKNETVYTSQVKPGKYAEKMTLGEVQVMGIVRQISEVLVNGRRTEFNYDKKRSYLTVKDLEVDFTNEFELSWK